MTPTLEQVVADFAAAMQAVDARRPVASSGRGDRQYQPGIGPHPEDEVVRLCIEEMAAGNPVRYSAHARGVPYGNGNRAKCDLCLGRTPAWEWAIEAKLLRFLGDNGKPNDNMLMHILSPYAQHHSALCDCPKLAASPLAKRKAILIFGYPHENWPLEPAIDAFELLARRDVRLGPRVSMDTGPLVHRVHSRGRVFGWDLTTLAAT